MFVTIVICAASAARRPRHRRLPAAGGLRRARGLRAVPRRRHGRDRDGGRQRPDRAVRRAGDAVARACTSSPPATAAAPGARRAASSTSSSAASRRRSCSTGSRSSTAPPDRRTSPTIVASFQGTTPLERNDALVLAGAALLLVGLGFKVAAAPFHVWTPDVYQGAPTPVTSFMASVGKVAAFAALLRVLRRRAALLPRRLAAGRVGAGAGLDARRLVPRRRADRRQADARLLLDQPRRLHARRPRGRRHTAPARPTVAPACRA